MLSKSNNRFAIVDLGSNSFHLLLGSISSQNNAWQVEQQINEAVQLRAGLTEQGDLSWESMNRALTCLDSFATRLSKFAPDVSKVRIIGTATLRRAKNRALFLSHATKRLGYPIEVISGEEEAELIYHAFVQYLGPQTISEPLLGIDAGGGSTELVIGFGPEPKLSLSLPIGCIELQAYFLGKDAVTAESFTLANQLILEQFRAAERQIHTFVAFGWDAVYAGSGSADILAHVNQALGLGKGNDISLSSLRQIRDYLISLQDYRHFKILGLKDNQLLILPGIVAIFLALMNHLQLDKITMLPVGLRHGALAVMFSATLQPLSHNS